MTVKAEYELDDKGRATAILWHKKGKNASNKCPFCKRRHTHGWNGGRRVPHCEWPTFKNSIVTKDGTILSPEDGYIIKDY